MFFAMPGHTLVNSARVLCEFAGQVAGNKRVAIAFYMSNGTSSFREPKATPPPVIKAPEVLGLSILPEGESASTAVATTPFWVDLSIAEDSSEVAEEAVSLIQVLFESSTKKVLYDSQAFHRTIARRFPRLAMCLEYSTVFDTKLAGWALNPDAGDENLTFPELIFEHLSAREAPGQTVPDYLVSDMRNSLALADKLQKLVHRESLTQGLSLETMVVPILAEMESHGVVFNLDGLKVCKQLLQDRLHLIDIVADRMIGFKVNLSSPKQVGHVLYEVLKLSASGKHGKTAAPSTSETAIKRLCNQHAFPKLVLEHRRTQKLLSQYIISFEEKARQEGGLFMIHSHWMHTSTGTGRLSSVNPNLQNLPRGVVTLKPVTAEDPPVILNIRDAFASLPGHVLVASDYSQIELRLLAHFTKDERLLNAFREGTDFHSTVASKICGKAVTEITEDERSKAKRVVFGVLYGMGVNTLAEILHLDKPQAERWRNTFFAQFPGVQRFIQETIASARKESHVKTILGRRRLVAGIKSENKAQRARAERQAVNAIIQGSAADIMKAAMVRI
jgi:DNA polymerase I-like protein with 3'-5' exonuclease and polymerase domains